MAVARFTALIQSPKPQLQPSLTALQLLVAVLLRRKHLL